MQRIARLALAAALLVAAGLGCKKGPVPIEQIKDIVPVTVDEDGFHPDHIPALVGRPITLVVTRRAEKTCASAIVIAQENIRRDLTLNSPTMVTFIPEKPGDVHFACPTNEQSGEIAVQDVEATEVEKPGGAKKLKMKKVGAALQPPGVPQVPVQVPTPPPVAPPPVPVVAPPVAPYVPPAVAPYVPPPSPTLAH
jgi:hypothetical protein